MQVIKIEYRQLALSLKNDFKTAHDTTTKRPLILIAVTLDDGTIGYGEVQAFDNHEYAPQDQNDALIWLDAHLANLTDWYGESVAELIAQLPMDGQFARAGVEMAIWDAVGKHTNQSLADMLGEHVGAVSVGIALGLQEFEAVSMAHQAGYQRIKLKQNKSDENALTDLSQLVKRFPNQLFSLDFNASLSDTPASQQYLTDISALGIDLIEEPLSVPTFDSYSELSNDVSPMKISLDESLNSIADVSDWLTKSTVLAYTIKQGKLGGISIAKASIDAVITAGKLPWIGGMLASGLGRAVDVALASQVTTNLYPADISKSERYFVRDIVKTDLTFCDGQVIVPTEPGIGVQLDWDAIHDLQVGKTVTLNLLEKP